MDVTLLAKEAHREEGGNWGVSLLARWVLGFPIFWETEEVALLVLQTIVDWLGLLRDDGV